jgi:TonB-dependent receptor
MKSRLLAGVAPAMYVVAAVTPTQAIAGPQRQAFSIPAGDLKSALDTYVRQTGRQLIYRADLIRGARSPGVYGSLAADAALAALLKGTGFVARTDKSGAIAIVSAVGNGQRAEAAPQNNRTATADTNPAAASIVIVGTRASLQSAEAEKRRSAVMIDGITADNIGQLPDVSISESLIRISGVTSNDTARGSDQVAIDGLGPDLVSTEYNGRILPTADGVTRRVGLAGLPTEGISAAYAQKTPDPATIEGGVAGILELQTVKPLATSRKGLTVVLRGLYSDTAAVVRDTDGIDPFGYRGEVSYTAKLAPNFGVTFSYAHLHQADAETGVQLDGWRLGTGARADLNGDGTSDALPTTAGPFLSSFNTTRNSLIATAQWKPSPAILITLDGLYDRDHWTSGTRRYFANGLFSGGAPTSSTVTDDAATAFNGTAQQYRGTIQRSNVVDHTYEGGLNLLLDKGPFTATFDASIAEAGRDRFTPQANFENAAATAAGQVEPFAYDIQDRSNVGFTFAPLSANNYAIQQVNTVAQNSIDRLAAFREDSTYRIANSSFLKSLQFGVRVDRRHHVQQVDNTLYNYATLAARPLLDSTDLETVSNPFARASSRFGGSSATTFPYYDLDTLLQIGENGAGVKVNPQYGSDYGASSDILEWSYAGYAQANIDTGRLTGNVGARYIRTNETDQGLSGTDPSNAVLQKFKNSYHYFLPSLNLKYAITPTLDVRFAASRTLSRPVFGDLAVGSSTNLAAVDSNGFVTINRGNPDLKPFTADGINVAAEWHPNRATSFALFGYYKWVTNFTTQSTITSSVTLPDGTVVPAFINQTVNEPAKKHFRGFEVQARRDLNFLPGALRYLGIQGNWNHNSTDARDTFTSLVGHTIDVLPINFSRDVFNAQLYYSRRDVDVHIAYRYYSGYSRTFSNGYQYMPGGQFDAGMSFALTPRIRFLANMTNILGTSFYRTTADYRHPDSNGILQHYGYQGRDFTLGIRANF